MKLDYLQKYVGGGKRDAEGVAARRVRPKAVQHARVRVLDQDAIVRTKRSTHDDSEDDGDAGARGSAPVKHVKLGMWTGGAAQDAGSTAGRQGAAAPATSGDNASPPRRQRHDSGDDASPPRRRAQDDASPPRRQRHDSGDDASPPRRHAQDDASPPRRQRHDSGDGASPPRRSPPRRAADDKKTLSGMTAGLRTSDQVKQEIDAKVAAERAKLAALSAEASGRDAATVFRSRDGRAVSSAEYADERRPRAKYEPTAEQLQVSRGIVQVRAEEERRAALEREATKPLAQYADDRERDAEFRDREHWEDPMLQYMRKKKAESARAEAGSSSAGGPPAPAKPRYTGPAAPPNRFGILPGHRWDGVVRGNGFEKRLFAAQANRAARSAAAFAANDDA